jgi:glycerol-3-phosphate cytidylyltransferase
VTEADRENHGTDQTVVGYVPSGWDAFHIGHLKILLRAREKCDRLVVGVVTDEALFQAKGNYPVVPLAERMQLVAHLNMVDDVVVDFSSNKLEVWDKVRFDVLLKGDDWRGTAKGDKLAAERGSAGDGFAADALQQGSTELTDLAADSGWVGGLELRGQAAGVEVVECLGSGCARSRW